MQHISIRRAVEEDVKHIAGLLRQLFEYKKVKLRHIKESLSEKTVFVASHQKRVVGLISMVFFFNKRMTYIKEVVVDRRFRGRRIGEKLLNKAMGHARKNSSKFVLLVSAIKRTGAHSFYLKNNFKRINLITGFFYRRVDG